MDTEEIIRSPPTVLHGSSFGSLLGAGLEDAGGIESIRHPKVSPPILRKLGKHSPQSASAPRHKGRSRSSPSSPPLSRRISYGQDKGKGTKDDIEVYSGIATRAGKRLRTEDGTPEVSSFMPPQAFKALVKRVIRHIGKAQDGPSPDPLGPSEGREQEDPMASSAVFSVEKPQNEDGVLGGIRADVNGLGVAFTRLRGQVSRSARRVRELEETTERAVNRVTETEKTAAGAHDEATRAATAAEQAAAKAAGASARATAAHKNADAQARARQQDSAAHSAAIGGLQNRVEALEITFDERPAPQHPAASSVAVTALQHEVKSIANDVRSAVQAGEVLRGTRAVLDSLQVEIESVRRAADGGAQKADAATATAEGARAKASAAAAEAAGATQAANRAAASAKAAATNIEEAAAAARRAEATAARANENIEEAAAAARRAEATAARATETNDTAVTRLQQELQQTAAAAQQAKEDAARARRRNDELEQLVNDAIREAQAARTEALAARAAAEQANEAHASAQNQVGEVERAVQKVQGDVRREVLEVKRRVEEIRHESSVTRVRVEALASDSEKSFPPIVAKTSETAGQNSEFAEILQSAQQCILEAQNEANRAQSEANRAQVEAQGAQRIQLATETMLDRARPEIEDAVGRSEAAVLTIQGTSGLVDQRIKFFEELAAKCTRETHAALDKLNTSQSSGPSAPPPPGSGGSVPHLEAEIRKVQDMAEACRLHAGNAMRSAQEALGSQTAAHENAVAAAQAAAGMSRVDTQVAGPSSHTCTAQFTPELQVQIELLNPQMKEMNNALQLAINNVADMATDKFASVSARVQDFEDSLLGKLGSPENGGPRLGDLDLDIRAHSDQLTRIWEQLEMQNHDLDLYLETLRDMEKKGAQNEPERQQNSRSEGPRDSRANPQPTSRRTGGETGPWYDDRRSERSDGSRRSRSRDRPRHDVPHWRTRRRESLESDRSGRSRLLRRRDSEHLHDDLGDLPSPPSWWKKGPWGPLPGCHGVRGDVRWFQIAPYMNGAYFAPGKAYRANKMADGLGAEQDEILPRRNKIQPTGIAGDMAFREARPPLKFKDFKRVPLDAVAAASEGCFGEHKNSWLDPTIREALEKTAKVPLWDGDQKTLEDWSQKMLRWRKDHAFRFDDKQQANILIAAVNNKGEQDRIYKAYHREDMSTDELWRYVAGRVMGDINRPETVWRKRTIPDVVLTSRIWTDWMADWIEEGAGIPYGVTIREATTVMITLLKEHCKQVPQDKDAQRAYHKIYSVQADYGGVELNYLEIFLLVLPFIQTREYKERKEEHILSCQGAETKKVRAFGDHKGGSGGDRHHSRSRDDYRRSGGGKSHGSSSGGHKSPAGRRDSVTSTSSFATTVSRQSGRSEHMQKSRHEREKCRICGQRGHYHRDCPERKKGKDHKQEHRSRSGSKAKPDDICRKCGKKGHWASECRERSRSKEQPRSRSLSQGKHPGGDQRSNSKGRPRDGNDRPRSRDRRDGSGNGRPGSNGSQRRSYEPHKDRSKSRSPGRGDQHRRTSKTR